MTTETVLGLIALAIVASAGIFAYIVLAARRKKAKEQVQPLLGTVYPTTNRKKK